MVDDLFDLNIDFDMNIGFETEEEKKEKEEEKEKQKIETRTKKIKERISLRRANSEKELYEKLDWHFQKGYSYHVISGGDIDSLTFLRLILKQQKLDYCLISTWVLGKHDVEEIDFWLSKNLIKKMDIYVGEIFKKQYPNEYLNIKKLIEPKYGRVAIFRNHSKVMSGFGKNFDFVTESSANVNTNPRTENTTITINRELALFYKNFYDGIRSFEKSKYNWEPVKI